MNDSLSDAQVLLVQLPTGPIDALGADLQALGYQLATASDAKGALMQADLSPALIMIDSELGKDCGFQLCRQLRAVGVQVPMLMLMPTETVADRTACLDAGADDYVLQPYQREALQDRLRLYLQPSQDVEVGQHLRFIDLVLHLPTRTAMRKQRTIDLTMKEFELLKLFMEHPGEVLTREQILDQVWGYDFMGESNVIEVYIRYLRLKIEASADQRLIHTVRGVGYVLREA
ncbi:Response regulator MprA [Acaryochloris thomasi RCC1774]|uniref:Response regulator MprA n=1 Tax=Acaryochloris thomasi RCC1774 TaxID=1764569 RepID=A0A2W1K1A6_9CYAN|nr:response regulator transcription factor [Acaryochloris thomasi]PZD74301.1 Response regulator MprA [Acaryochloris thomasi RCC1774]